MSEELFQSWWMTWRTQYNTLSGECREIPGEALVWERDSSLSQGNSHVIAWPPKAYISPTPSLGGVAWYSLASFLSLDRDNPLPNHLSSFICGFIKNIRNDLLNIIIKYNSPPPLQRGNDTCGYYVRWERICCKLHMSLSAIKHWQKNKINKKTKINKINK